MFRKTVLAAALAVVTLAAGTASAQWIKKPSDLDPNNRQGSVNKSLRDLDQERLKQMSRDPRPGRDFTKFYIQNDTKDSIKVAIRYIPFRAPDNTSGLKEYAGDGFETKAWFTLKPGERAHVANTANRFVYTYAEGGGRLWAGDGKNTVGVKDGNRTRDLSFRKQNTGEEIKEEYTLKFTAK